MLINGIWVETEAVLFPDILHTWWSCRDSPGILPRYNPDKIPSLLEQFLYCVDWLLDSGISTGVPDSVVHVQKKVQGHIKQNQ